MRVLIACEYSGVVRDAFLRQGHEAMSCDLLPTESPGPHYVGDCRDLLNDSWDLLIAHPPCTRLCNSGVRWLAERNLWEELREASQLFRDILDAPIPKIAIENPVMHRHAKQAIWGTLWKSLGQPDFTIQPWQFGHGETKRTCFWTKGLPALRPTQVVPGRENKVHRMSPSKSRWRDRSRTYSGIAEAMARQWGGDQEQRLAS